MPCRSLMPLKIILQCLTCVYLKRKVYKIKTFAFSKHLIFFSILKTKQKKEQLFKILYFTKNILFNNISKDHKAVVYFKQLFSIFWSKTGYLQREKLFQLKVLIYLKLDCLLTGLCITAENFIVGFCQCSPWKKNINLHGFLYPSWVALRVKSFCWFNLVLVRIQKNRKIH